MTQFSAYPDLLHGTAGPVLRLDRPENATLADLIGLVPVEAALRPHLRVKLNGEMIAPALYRRIRPKDGAYITVYLPLHGGGDSGKLLSSIAAIALIGASLFVGAFGIGFLGASFAAGSVGANLVAGGLSIAASLLLQGLQPTQGGNNTQTGKEVGVASAQNTFELGGYLQRVIGTRKVAPKMIMAPYTYFEGDDQVVVLAYGLSGPHQIEDVRVGYAKVADDPNIEIQIREGFADDTPIDLFDQTVIEQSAGIAMTDFITVSSTEASDELDTSLSTYLPQWHRLETRNDPDAAVINFSFPGGLFNLTPSDPDSDAQVSGVTALRVRLRRAGLEEWDNLPELVLRGRRGQDAIRFAIKFVWCAAGDIPAMTAFTPNWKGFSWKYNVVLDASSTWIAGTYLAGNVLDWEDSQHITVYLDTAVYPKDRYEFEAIRGQTIHSNIWNPTTHSLDGWGTFFDPEPGSPPTLVRGLNRYVRDISIDTVQSIYDEHPFDFSAQPTTVIAMKARNRSITQVSCVASGYAPDWDGASWVADQITSNPASWYREVLSGGLNAEPVPLSLINSPELQDWHAWCTAEDLQVNAIIERESVSSTLSIIAQAGFARPSYGAPYRAIMDKRRDAEVGVITQRNAGGFSFEKPFARLAHGLRVSFADADNDYEVRELIVYADGYNADGSGGKIEATRFEAISYPGIVHESIIVARAKRDLRTAKHRTKMITFTMDIEHLEFQMGDLVRLETDILGQLGGRGRATDILIEGGLVAGLRLDEEWNFDKADADTVDRGVTMRLNNGTVLTAKVTGQTADRQLVRFSTPFAMPSDGGDDLIVPGTLVATGKLTQVARPVLAWDIVPGPDLTATITAIDYAADEIYGASAFSSAFSAAFGSGLY